VTVRLRPHHLLCLLTYVGKGYNSAFTVNFNVIAGRLSNDEDILVVAGPDDICAPLLLDADQHCWNDSVTERDRLAARDVGELLSMAQPIPYGAKFVLDSKRIAKMREAFVVGAIRHACAGCEWHELCSQIADGDYACTAVIGSSHPNRSDAGS